MSGNEWVDYSALVAELDQTCVRRGEGYAWCSRHESLWPDSEAENSQSPGCDYYMGQIEFAEFVGHAVAAQIAQALADEPRVSPDSQWARRYTPGEAWNDALDLAMRVARVVGGVHDG